MFTRILYYEVHTTFHCFDIAANCFDDISKPNIVINHKYIYRSHLKQRKNIKLLFII